MTENEAFFINAANQIATNSLCMRRKVGAVLVKDGNILLRTCNGGISPCPECVRDRNGIQTGTLHKICLGIHAEKRLLQQAMEHSIETRSATVYCTHSPCYECTADLVVAGIAEFIYLQEYPDAAFMSNFEKNGILYRQIRSDKK